MPDHCGPLCPFAAKTCELTCPAPGGDPQPTLDLEETP